MGRLLTIALTLSALAALGTVLAGGVEPKDEFAEAVREATEVKRAEKAKAAAPATAAPAAAAAPARGKTGIADATNNGSRLPSGVKVTGKTITVNVRNLSFSPPVIAAAPGDRVAFVNEDDVPHNVVTEDNAGNGAPSFSSGAFGPATTVSFVIPGQIDELRYVCTLHAVLMDGRIAVSS